MYRYSSMGPRGRWTGHRGSVPAIVAGVVGLMFFGWIILAVLGAVLGAGVMVLGSVFAVLGRVIPYVVSRFFTAESFAIGVAIGLVWSAMKRMRNAEAAREEERAAAETAPAEEAEPEIIETRHYTFHA